MNKIAHFCLTMGEKNLRLRMKPELKMAIFDETQKRRKEEKKYISMTTVINDILCMVYNIEKNHLKSKIEEDSFKKTRKAGRRVSMNSIVNDILEKYFLEGK